MKKERLGTADLDAFPTHNCHSTIVCIRAKRIFVRDIKIGYFRSSLSTQCIAANEILMF